MNKDIALEELGYKKEETLNQIIYKKERQYYDSRLNRYCHMSTRNVMEHYIPNNCIDIIFRNGYSKNSPSIKCKCSVWFEYGKEKWGAEPGKLYYVLRILSVEEIQ